MKTIKLSSLTAELLPALRTLYGDDDGALSKAINDHIKTYQITVTSDDGKPLGDTEFVVHGQAVTKAQAATASTDPQDWDKVFALVKKAVSDSLSEQTKTINKAVSAIVTGGDARNDDKKKNGFASFGDFAVAVKAAVPHEGAAPTMDERLRVKAPTTYANEGAGGDGGFLVPPDFREEITRIMFDEPDLIARTDRITTARNSVTIPVDETTPWGTNGVTAYWLAEAAQKPQSKPILKRMTIDLDKIAVLVPVTDELLEDAPMMDTYLRRKAGEKLAFAGALAIVQGSGTGQPLGILNSPALVSVAKVGSQVADTVVGLNVLAMWSRLYAPWRRNSVWLANQDIEPQLALLMKSGKLDTGAADTGWGIGPLYYQGTESGQPTLMGRPVIYTQTTETLGDKGDIILADLSQYMTLLKSGGVKTDVSIHLWFDYDVTAFRFVLRMGGQPWLSAPIAARDGSATYSAFVTLDERA